MYNPNSIVFLVNVIPNTHRKFLAETDGVSSSYHNDRMQSAAIHLQDRIQLVKMLVYMTRHMFSASNLVQNASHFLETE